MKKKLLSILFVLLFAFLCGGCNGTITRNIRHAGFTISGKFACQSFLPEKEDSPYTKIRYFLGNQIIDETGKIYDFSSSLKFSSGDYCREANSSILVKAIFDNSIVKGQDNKYYYLTGQNNVSAYSEVPQTDNSYYLYDMFLKDEDVVKVMTADNSQGIYFLLKTDGSVYRYQTSKKDYNSQPTVTSISVEYDKNQYGEIVDFSYVGNSLGTFIRTNDKLYRMRVTNLEECSSYADIACVYELQEDPIFEEYRDTIIVYNGSTLITNYGKMFTVAN